MFFASFRARDHQAVSRCASAFVKHDQAELRTSSCERLPGGPLASVGASAEPTESLLKNTPWTYLRALRAPVVIASVLFRPRVRSDRSVVRPAPSPGSQVEARHRWERSIRRGRLPKPCRPRLTGGYSSYTDKNYVCPKSIDSGPRCPVSPLSDLCWWHAFGASQSGPRSSVLPPRVMS